MRAARRVLVLTIAHAGLMPGVAMAQSSVQFRPSLSVTQTYDSNLFSTPSAPAADFVSRLTPAADAEYLTPQWTLSARHSFDMERFANHRELDSFVARQHATARWQYRPVARVSLAAAAEFTETHSPWELNTLTGLTFARATAQRIGGHLSASRQLNERTDGKVEYGLTQDRLAGNVSVATEVASVSTERRLRPRTSALLRYRYRRYAFDSSSTISHTIDLGWTRDLSSRVRLSVDGGPTLTSGSPSLDVSAAITGRSRDVEYSLAYVRTQTTALGLVGLVGTDSLTMSTAWRASRTLQIRLSPGVYRSSQGSVDAMVYRVAFSAVQSIVPTLSIEAAVDSHLQRGLLYPSLAGQSIRRHEAVIRLVAAPARPRSDHASAQ